MDQENRLDLEQAFQFFQENVESRAMRGTGSLKVLVVALSEHESSVQSAIERGLAGWLSVQCHEQEFIAALRKLTSAEQHPPVDWPPRGGMAPLTLRRICEHIEREIANTIRLQELADIAGLSIAHFSRAFRQSMGMPPRRYMSQRRIEAAAERIRDTSLPLSEIALSLGFSDQSHFTRVFVRLRGETPAMFRRRHR